MIQAAENPGALKGKDIRGLLNYAEAGHIASRIGADNAKIGLGKETALYARANSQDGLRNCLRNLRSTRVLGLNKPECDTLRTPRADTRHSPKLPD